jgi:nucleotide-binding universal stress UspA family protein
MKFKKILFPVDFSEPSKRCLEVASGLLSKEHVKEIHFLYVLRTPSDFSVWEGDPLAEVGRRLQEIGASFHHEGKHETRTAVLFGHPATEICRYAAEHGCDLIVLATHGRTGLKHMLLGSTTEQVVRHAPCPVLTLRLGPT